MHRVALVTYSELPSLSADDRRVLAPMAQRGLRAEAVAWDDPAAAWDSYDALVVRSTWNYHLAPDAFGRWIDRIESLGAPVWNPPPILRWNSTKTYLRELESRGFEIVPTHWVAGDAAPTLAEVLAGAGWSDAVVKPAISASAYGTSRVQAGRLMADQETRFRQLLARPGGAMVQRFVPELARDGEWSLMFLGGAYSHAVLKRPRDGDFRVQHEHGGTAESRIPPPRAVETATAILRSVPSSLLYARVDGVEVDGRFVLVELELLEPSLFLGANAGAPGRFAEAICEALGRQR